MFCSLTRLLHTWEQTKDSVRGDAPTSCSPNCWLEKNQITSELSDARNRTSQGQLSVSCPSALQGPNSPTLRTLSTPLNFSIPVLLAGRRAGRTTNIPPLAKTIVQGFHASNQFHRNFSPAQQGAVTTQIHRHAHHASRPLLPGCAGGTTLRTKLCPAVRSA